MSDQTQKNRIAFIEHLYAEPELGRGSKSSYYDDSCLCFKGQYVRRFVTMLEGKYRHADFLLNSCFALSEDPAHPAAILGMTKKQWVNAEFIYEGWNDGRKKTYKEMADWLQTLPGWPQVTINRKDSDLWLEEQLAFLGEKEPKIATINIEASDINNGDWAEEL